MLHKVHGESHTKLGSGREASEREKLVNSANLKRREGGKGSEGIARKVLNFPSRTRSNNESLKGRASNASELCGLHPSKSIIVQGRNLFGTVVSR